LRKIKIVLGAGDKATVEARSDISLEELCKDKEAVDDADAMFRTRPCGEFCAFIKRAPSSVYNRIRLHVTAT